MKWYEFILYFLLSLIWISVATRIFIGVALDVITDPKNAGKLIGVFQAWYAVTSKTIETSKTLM